jgi:3-dehydroquinate synthase
VTEYRRFRHGEAVGYGILCAARIAEARGALVSEKADAIARLVAQLGPIPPIGDLSASEVLEAIRYDKKVVDGRLHFVLPTDIGTAIVADDVTPGEIEQALEGLGMRRS